MKLSIFTDISEIMLPNAETLSWNNFLMLGFVFAIFAIIVHYWITHWTRTARLINKFSGPNIIPLLGNFSLVLGPYEGPHFSYMQVYLQKGATLFPCYLQICRKKFIMHLQNMAKKEEQV
jgi:hypothetical protein